MDTIKQITKNQHYVPQFYMKPFSTIGNKNNIPLISFFQFKGNFCKDNVSIESVCSEKFFYDKDGKIENELANKEGIWANAISKVNCGEELTKSEIDNVREFALYQIDRTKAMLAHNQNMAMTAITAIKEFQCDEDNCLGKSATKELVENEITPEFDLNLAKNILQVIDDLEMGVLENKSSINFITSDAPVIIINPLKIRCAGLEDIGVVIFFPISKRKMIMFYDSKFYGKITGEIEDPKCIIAFNKYQYVGAYERVLASNSIEFKNFIEDEELNNFRKKFYDASKITTNHDGIGTLIAFKSRNIEYYFDIPILKLPKSLRKIPRDFRETFPRKYSLENKELVLCRIYGELDSNEDEKFKTHLKQMREYSKKLLDYLDFYWKTPKEDMFIPAEQMCRLKKSIRVIFPK